MKEQCIHLRTLDLFYAEEGEGPSCLLLHGGPGMDHQMFVPWLSPLASSRHLLYLDYRGNGRSQRISPEQFSITAIIADLEVLRQSLGVAQMDVLGHSFGGFVALSYALAHPDHVSHLVISCSAPSRDYRLESQELIGKYLATHPLGTVPLLPPGDADDVALRRPVFGWLPLYFATYEAKIRRVAEDWASRTRYSSAIYAEWLRQEPSYDLRARLREVQVPTLLLAGRYDRICPLTQSLLMSQSMPHAQLEIFEHSGHMPQMEEPERYRTVVRDFLLVGNSAA